MSLFFKKLRRRIFGSKKITSYLAYALGEIVLIVIGILVALAINDWTERKAAQKREHFYLTSLEKEFQENLIRLTTLIQVNKSNYKEGKILAGYVQNPAVVVQENELSAHFFNAFSSEIAYHPNNAVVDELINSGKLEDLTNDELRQRLTGWNAFLQGVHLQENVLGQQREAVLIAFENGGGNIRQIFDDLKISSEMLQLRPAEVQASNVAVLSSTAFDNALLQFILTALYTESNHYQPLRQEIETILNLIETSK